MGDAVGDLGEDGGVALVIEQEVELDRTLGLTIGSPVEEGDTEFDEGGVETEELVLEAELLLARGDGPDPLQKLIEDCFIEPEGSFLVGIGEGGAAGGLGDAEMRKLPQAAGPASADLPLGVSLSQLTEEHGDKLAPRGEPFCSFVCFRFLHRCVELRFGEYL